jgi:hypothetical protein
LDDIRPVKNGNAAEPAVPTPDTHASDPERIQRGKTAVMWLISIGYIGPT